MLLIALAAIGCAKVETEGVDEGGEAMNFGIYVPRNVSKADSDTFVEGTVLPDNSSFGVFAFYQPGVVFSGTPATWNASTRKPDFMFNQQVDFDGTDYTYTPLRYWPSNEENTISFWAYYPYSIYSTDNSSALKFYESDGTTAYSANSTGLPKIKYTVSTNPNNQYDILFDTFTNQNKTYDNCSPTPGTVPLKFRHALSLIQFNISAGGGALPEGAVVTISTLSLTNVKSEGVCADPSASVETEVDAGNYWSSVANPGTIALPEGATDFSLILMPQQLLENGSTGTSQIVLTIGFDLSFPAADNREATITYKNNLISAPIWSDVAATPYGTKKWLPARKYTYNVTAGLEEIEFSEVFTEEWTTASTTDL